MENRILHIGTNPLLRALGSVTYNDASEESLRQAGEVLVNKYKEIVATLDSREDTRVKSLNLWDLLNIDVLSDENLLTDEDLEILAVLPNLRAVVKGIKSTGIEFTNDDFANISVISTKITNTPKEVCERLYNSFKGILVDPTSNDHIDDIIVDATKDLIGERTTFVEYAIAEGLISNGSVDDDELVELQNLYATDYDEWVNTEAERIVSQIIQNPLQTVMILPKGFDKVKNSILDLLPSDPDTVAWVNNNLTPSNIFSGAVWEELTKLLPDKSKYSEIVKLTQEFVANNSITVTNAGNGQPIPLLYTVNIAEVLLHALILASSELVYQSANAEDISDDEFMSRLSPNTAYVLSEFMNYIGTDEVLKDYTPNIELTASRMLSTISDAIPLATARLTSIRGINREYNVATTSITTFINNSLMEETKADLAKSEEEKND